MSDEKWGASCILVFCGLAFVGCFSHSHISKKTGKPIDRDCCSRAARAWYSNLSILQGLLEYLELGRRKRLRDLDDLRSNIE